MNRKILDIFYSNRPKDAYIAMQAIDSVYQEILESRIVGLLEMDERCFSTERKQYDADLLLKKLLGSRNLFLWIVHEDMFSDDLNFVFGCALPSKGSVLSTFRLKSSDLIEKEVIHEIGHVLGLNHCRNKCVMMFSNSLYEAMLKPKDLCNSCKERLRNIYGSI